MKTRIISALLLLLCAIPIIIAGGKVFSLAVGLVGILAFREILNLRKTHQKIPFLLAAFYYLCFILTIYINPFDATGFMGLSYRLLIFIFLVYCIPTLFYANYTTQDAFGMISMTLFLGLACHSILVIRTIRLSLFFYLIFVPICTDTFAYFFGTLIGRHSLCKISPKKTWEGSILGSFSAMLLGSLFYLYFVSQEGILWVILLTLVLSIVSQLGDLFFSKIKRENEIKDYSDLIPRHGGILDRFDSIIMTSIVMKLFITYF